MTWIGSCIIATLFPLNNSCPVSLLPSICQLPLCFCEFVLDVTISKIMQNLIFCAWLFLNTASARFLENGVCGWICFELGVFRWISTPLLASVFICLWTPRQILHTDCCKWCHSEHGGTHTPSMYRCQFFRIHTCSIYPNSRCYCGNSISNLSLQTLFHSSFTILRSHQPVQSFQLFYVLATTYLLLSLLFLFWWQRTLCLIV